MLWPLKGTKRITSEIEGRALVFQGVFSLYGRREGHASEFLNIQQQAIRIINEWSFTRASSMRIDNGKVGKVENAPRVT